MNVLTSNTGEVINKYGALEKFGKKPLVRVWTSLTVHNGKVLHIQVVLMCYMLESVRR